MLFEGEKVTWVNAPHKDVNTSDIEINNKYLAGEVRIVTEQARYPLDTITAMIASDKYILMPAFQRRHRWDITKKSRLIESFIMNVPIPPIFLYETEYSHYEVMDGLQRLTAIIEFYSNSFSLTGLELWPELNGKTYSQLPDKVKKGIDRRYLSSIILLEESAKTPEKAQEMKQLVFERINSGGVKLEPQETRNALYDGPMNQLCVELSRNKYLCLLFKIPHKDIEDIDQMQLDDLPAADAEEKFQKWLDNNPLYRSMSDVELVLRFFAIRNLEGYSSQFSNFLDSYLIAANRFSPTVLEGLKKLFEDTISFAYELFGEKAFYLWRRRKTKSGVNWGWFERASTTVYDPLMFALSQQLPQKETLLSHAEAIQKEITKVYEDNYPTFEGRNSNRNDIEKRIAVYLDFFRRYTKG